MTFNELIGTLGVGIILLAYFCNIFGFLKRNGTLFFLLNIIGAGLACYASVLIRFLPFVFLEATWALVSFIGLLRTLKSA